MSDQIVGLRECWLSNLSNILGGICRTWEYDRWYTWSVLYMKLVTKYQISAINSCWEKCDKKCAYMFNVYKNQLSRQTGSRNLTGPKTLPTIWYTYMMLVTKYKISAINSNWEKCDEKYLGRTDRGKTVYPPPPSGSGGINIKFICILVWNKRKCLMNLVY